MDKQDQAAPLVSVTFIGSASPYHEGDLAGFPADEAQAYVDKGKAVFTKLEVTGVDLGVESSVPVTEQAQAPAEGEAEAQQDLVTESGAEAAPEGKPARKK